MIKTVFFNFLFLVLIFSSGCSSSNEASPFVFGKGKYNFTMTDSTEKTIVKGIINVLNKTDNNISGTYELKNIYEPDFPGLSTMEGSFEGNINETQKTVFINTNPRIADSNVFWNLEMKKNSLSGEWNFSVFRGSINKGKIKITK
ncbi:MAG: hypothetical protein M3R36_12300 [Bacteroidota bacterium]|nr:hypothetical protein [Bacteroidota bacterium]